VRRLFGAPPARLVRTRDARDSPRAQVDIVIVSCSCFAPTPSMAAMLVNHFKMRRDVLTYNLSGMGCSSSLICVDMAKHLLKARTAGREGHEVYQLSRSWRAKVCLSRRQRPMICKVKSPQKRLQRCRQLHVAPVQADTASAWAATRVLLRGAMHV